MQVLPVGVEGAGPKALEVGKPRWAGVLAPLRAVPGTGRPAAQARGGATGTQVSSRILFTAEALSLRLLGRRQQGPV